MRGRVRRGCAVFEGLGLAGTRRFRARGRPALNAKVAKEGGSGWLLSRLEASLARRAENSINTEGAEDCDGGDAEDCELQTATATEQGEQPAGPGGVPMR